MANLTQKLQAHANSLVAEISLQSCELHTVANSPEVLTERVGQLRESFDGLQLSLANAYSYLPDGRKMFTPEYEALRGLFKRRKFGDEYFNCAVLNQDHRVVKLLFEDIGIRSMKFLEVFHKLEELWLNGNEISDVSPLRHLTELNKLVLSFNRIVDISPLAGLYKLEDLSIRANNIIDYSPLARLTGLKELMADLYFVEDWKHVSHIPRVNKPFG